MSYDYPENTVAQATVRGVPGVLVLRRRTPSGRDWAHSLTVGYTCSEDNYVTDVQVVVSAPGGRHSADAFDRERLAEAIMNEPRVMDIMQDHGRGYAKINAIKEARALFGVGLKEAKEGVELVELWLRQGYKPLPPVTPEEEEQAVQSVLQAMRGEPDG